MYKHDPRSRWVVTAGGGSGNNDIIYDPTAFNWNGDSLTPPALNDLFIYELHVGTFPSSSSPSRFVAATNKLDYLKSLGVNAVEVMPIAEFGNGGNSWGYDPAQPFAVDNAQYGGPDGLKTFVQACHARGIAVLLDVVHNHYGPGLLDMWNFDGWSGSNSRRGRRHLLFSEQHQPANHALRRYAAQLQQQSGGQFHSGQLHHVAERMSCGRVPLGLGLHPDACNATATYIPAAGNLINAINAMIHTNYTGKISIAEDVYNYFGFRQRLGHQLSRLFSRRC